MQNFVSQWALLLPADARFGVAIGDVNDDSNLDLAVTNYNDKSISVFYMNNNSVVSIKTIAVGNRPDGIIIHD